jgi:hypothetical protein
MTLTLILIAVVTSTIGIIHFVSGRLGHRRALGSVSEQWLAEYRQDHGW